MIYGKRRLVLIEISERKAIKNPYQPASFKG
jgi:hypothetical protein